MRGSQEVGVDPVLVIFKASVAKGRCNIHVYEGLLN